MCDLSDPRITEAYNDIIEDEPTNWLILGYHDTRDVISLYSKGTDGTSEFRNHLVNEIQYGFVRVDDRFILITYVPDQVSGVRRARALVHSRSVAALFKMHHAQITASSLNDLSDSSIRTRLKLGENHVPNRTRPTSMSERKRASGSTRRRSTQLPSPSPSTPVPADGYSHDLNVTTEEPETFVEASEELPVTPSESVASNSSPQPGSSSLDTRDRPQTPSQIPQRPQTPSSQRPQTPSSQRPQTPSSQQSQTPQPSQIPQRPQTPQGNLDIQQQQRLAEQQQLQQQQRLAEQQQQLQEQQKFAEQQQQQRLAEQQQLQQQQRLAEQQQQQILAEQQQQQQQQRLAEQQQIQQQQRLAEQQQQQQKLAEEQQQQQLAEQQKFQQQQRAKQERAAAEEKKRLEEQEILAQAEAAAAAAAIAATKAKAEAKLQAEREQKARLVAAKEEEERRKIAERENIELLKKQASQRKKAETERNKDIVLSGFASVQPSNSPFWRRRYFIIRGSNLLLYSDELQKSPITTIDLQSVTRLCATDEEHDTYVPNAFVLFTRNEGSFQIFADNRKGATTIINALQEVISGY